MDLTTILIVATIVILLAPLLEGLVFRVMRSALNAQSDPNRQNTTRL